MARDAARPSVVSLSGVSKTFAGGAIGISGIDLEIAEGEFLSLLGPSGCGKTTTLRVIAGFEAPTAGRITVAGRDVTIAKPYDRPVNTVFQDYALFPHMNVSENVGFGLAVARVPGAEAAKRIATALDLVGLADKAKARVQALSGGQRQRVALARALVCEPKVLLLDEPLAALDAHLREQMQVELKKLQSRLGTTFVMVTHDQTEALSISDRIVVMSKGHIEQAASPSELYDFPATRFVAGFIGAMNLIDGTVHGVKDGRVVVAAGPLTLESEPASANATWIAGDRVGVAIRPEDVAVDFSGAGEQAVIVDVVFHGRTLRLHLALADGTALTADVPRSQVPKSPESGANVGVSVRASRAFA
ncbi:ABC transporter ATP-binding protein [Segnochrobactrum spirostomi]|uniref:ABC transporter ATP-binding protein n=1 Tax=Segnochrobactrum spirostomi TaxID=2608987 RepID=A0A6A7XY60_9HYPH|nr:ABC transporter ATP-binding protein [Segnochrobactrum spirostomi]MQT11303.1 ABC transporter ATP-binding protein [Segnochrobactrum spirostomi]